VSVCVITENTKGALCSNWEPKENYDDEAETVHVSLVRILMAVFDISHELEGYLLF
jgi:hypothetical protein